MANFFVATFLFALGVFSLFLLPLISTLIGTLTGWIVGFFFNDTIMGMLYRIGIDTNGLEMWQLGTFLGFVGGFFRSSSGNTLNAVKEGVSTDKRNYQASE